MQQVSDEVVALAPAPAGTAQEVASVRANSLHPTLGTVFAMVAERRETAGLRSFTPLLILLG